MVASAVPIKTGFHWSIVCVQKSYNLDLLLEKRITNRNFIKMNWGKCSFNSLLFIYRKEKRNWNGKEQSNNTLMFMLKIPVFFLVNTQHDTTFKVEHRKCLHLFCRICSLFHWKRMRIFYNNIQYFFEIK